MAHKEYNLFTPVPTVGATAVVRGQAVKFSSGLLVSCGAGASSVGDRALGFITQDAAAGEFASVAILGGGAVGIAAGNITAGAELKTNADGHLVATTTANDIVVAIAAEAAVDNDVFAILPVNPTKY